MSEAAFTPGPWRVETTSWGEQIHAGHASAPKYIAETGCDGEYSLPSDESEANARLIAAAPDLFEALCAAILELDAGGITLATRREMREAIAKAQVSA